MIANVSQEEPTIFLNDAALVNLTMELRTNREDGWLQVLPPL